MAVIARLQEEMIAWSGTYRRSGDMPIGDFRDWAKIEVQARGIAEALGVNDGQPAYLRASLPVACEMVGGSVVRA